MACFKFVTHISGWALQAIFIAGNLILFVSSLIGNSLVIYLVWNKAALRTPTYLLMSFLAMSDLLTSLFGQLSNFVLVTFLNNFDCTLVRAIAFMNVMNCASSLLLLSLIARDRYLHVSKRQYYLQHTSNRFAITASIICYLFGMIVASLFTFDNRTINISSTFVFAVLGNSSFVFICLKSRQISRILQDHKKQLKIHRQNLSALEQSTSIQSCNFEKSVNRSIFSVIILFFVSWTPIIILMIVFTVHNILNESIAGGYRVAFVWASTVSYFNGALNHVIYAYRCDAIGREIRKILAKIIGRNSIAPPTIQLEVLGKAVEPTENIEVERYKGSK